MWCFGADHYKSVCEDENWFEIYNNALQWWDLFVMAMNLQVS